MEHRLAHVTNLIFMTISCRRDQENSRILRITLHPCFARAIYVLMSTASSKAHIQASICFKLGRFTPVEEINFAINEMEQIILS